MRLSNVSYKHRLLYSHLLVTTPEQGPVQKARERWGVWPGRAARQGAPSVFPSAVLTSVGLSKEEVLPSTGLVLSCLLRKK